jgi:PAS domain S-box-containing protein
MPLLVLQPPVFWLIVTGIILLVIGTGVLLFYIVHLFRKRRDVQRFPWVVLLVILFISTPLITTAETLSSILFPIIYFKAGVIFIRGLISAISAYVLHKLFPSLLKIPTAQRLEEEVRAFRAMEDISLEGHIRTENGKMVKVNPKACKIYGYTEKEILNMDVRHLIWAEDYDRVMDLREKNHLGEYECLGRHKSGKKLYLEVRGKNILYDGKLVRITSIKDLTSERESAAEKAQRYENEIAEILVANAEKLTEKMKAELLAMVHDRKNL